MGNNKNTNIVWQSLIVGKAIGLGLLLSVASQAQDNDHDLDNRHTAEFLLESDHERCVALRQGQTCYKKITLRWRARQAGDYCITEKNTDRTLQCWQQLDQSVYEFELESNHDITYVLTRQQNTTVLASKTIKIAWVYKPKPSKPNGWRLF